MKLQPATIWLPSLILGALAAIAFAGCTPNAGDQQIQADQFALRGMVANNQQQIDALQEKIQRLQDQVAELEHNGAASGGNSNRLASIEQRLSKLEAQSNSANATASPNSTNPPGSEESAPPGAAENTENNGEGITGDNATGTTTSATAPSANAPSWRGMMEDELAASHDDPGAKLYRAGLLELKANKYPQALNNFQALQRRYPKSSLSEPAEFFAANALYEMGKYDQAILQFNDQTMRFPKGHFASAALLREAEAFMKINDRIDARLTLQKLLNDLPDSPEAPMAKSMMHTLAS
ncbi:MAG TPA: outer membrane protein assembly factor BamD [Candidatus Binataceae bacterium]|nr:outer membrane protein assembly factor BamD [Candidatus Binataceae bacterium]